MRIPSPPLSAATKTDTWKDDTVFEQDSFELLENILEEAGELNERVPYDKLVTTEFSQEGGKVNRNTRT